MKRREGFIGILGCPMPLAVLVAICLVALACGEPTKGEQCQPQCAERSGLDDGCGGTCDSDVGKTSGCDSCAVNEVCVDDKCFCAPACDGKTAGPDGCGGACDCGEGTVSNGGGDCVDPSDCTDTCADAGWTCGELCGKPCGSCGPDTACILGKCECQPVCDGASCTDGCGGSCDCAGGTICNGEGKCVAPEACDDTCDDLGLVCSEVCGQSCGACGDLESCVAGQCKEALNCPDCSLQFSLVSRTVVGKRLKAVTLAVDYHSGRQRAPPAHG